MSYAVILENREAKKLPILSPRLERGYYEYLDGEVRWITPDNSVGMPSDVYRKARSRLSTVASSTYALPPGTYTVSASVKYPDIECGVLYFTYPTSIDREIHGKLPMTFTIDKQHQDYSIMFSFGSWSGEKDSEYLFNGDVKSVHITEGTEPYHFESTYAVIRPEEISADNAFSYKKNAKTTATVYLYPSFEAFGFAKKDITLATIIEINNNAVEVYGRVVAITDSMDGSGRYRQELIIASNMEFLEDTSRLYYYQNGNETIEEAAARLLTAQRYDVEDERRAFYVGTVPNRESAYFSTGCKSDYECAKELAEKNGCELRARYENGRNYLDFIDKRDKKSDTAIIIGDNLKEISIERSVGDKLITRLWPYGGRNIDGSRLNITDYAYNYYGTSGYVENEELVAKYGIHEAIIFNESIYNNQLDKWDNTQVYKTAKDAAQRALYLWAVGEMEKLSEPYAKITLSAADLAAIGMEGYDNFEVGTTYPVVCPIYEIYRDMEISELKRSMSDRLKVDIAIESGYKLPTTSRWVNVNLSQALADLSDANSQKMEKLEQKQIELIDQAAEQQTDGVGLKQLTIEEYNALEEKLNNILYLVKNGEKMELYAGESHISSEGGGGGTIQNAVVLTAEQNTEWAPAHELVPVEFRGNANVFYGQAPARFVCQSQRVLFNTAPTYADDISTRVDWRFWDGSRERLVADIYAMTIGERGGTLYLWVNPRILVYDTSGAAEVLKGSIIGNTGAYYYSAQVPLTYTSMKVGIESQCVGFATYNDVLCARIQHRLTVMVDGAAVWRSDLRNDGNYYSTTGQDAYRCRPWSTDAEREFAIGISQRTEPSYPEEST